MDPRGFPTTLPEFQKVFPERISLREISGENALAGWIQVPKMQHTRETISFPAS
jgi:hypothetical protein